MVSKEPQAPGKLPMCEAPISADTSSSTIFRLRHLSVQGSNLLLPAHYLRPLRVWKIRNRGRAFGHSGGLLEAGRGGGGSGDSRLRRPAAVPLTSQARNSKRARAQQLRPLYLVSGRRIDRAGATDRLRPWSKETARSCKVVAPLFWQREPEQLPGPLRDKHGESPHPQGRATRPRRCHVWSLSARRLTREWTSPRSV